MLYYPRPLAELLSHLERLPGVGPKSAQRLAFHLLRASQDENQSLAASIAALHDSIHPCAHCGNFTDEEICGICRDPRRDQTLLCVVAEPRELLAVENSGEFRGLYHVLGGLINPLDGIGPDQLSFAPLLQRVREEGVQEVILALSATVEGETTANYLSRQLQTTGVKITQLARGLPFGGDLDYADQMTIAGALRGRRAV
jgi:recombination protein RecR